MQHYAKSSSVLPMLKTYASPEKGKRKTILLEGSKNGWVSNALGRSTNYIKDSLCEVLYDTEAIFLKNVFNNCHSRQIHKTLDSNNTKLKIQDHMNENDIL